MRLFGDSASALNPLGDLYKTQVRELAKQIGVPDRVIAKVPTAGLWKGQTDESELGISYENLDEILYGIELNLPDEEIAKRTGLSMLLLFVYMEISGANSDLAGKIFSYAQDRLENYWYGDVFASLLQEKQVGLDERLTAGWVALAKGRGIAGHGPA